MTVLRAIPGDLQTLVEQMVDIPEANKPELKKTFND